MSQAQIGNIERGERAPDIRLVADLDAGLSAEGRLERLWATLTGDGEPVWLDDLADLERRARSVMDSYDTVFPALLQTEGYARAAIRTFSPCATRDEVETTFEARTERARRFVSAEAPTYRAVLDVAVIRRCPNNDAKLMAEQVAHVVGLIERERISIQIVDIGWHPGLIGTFTLIAPYGAPDVVYVESADSGRMIDDPDRVQQFRVLLSDVQAVALTPERSLSLLREELGRLDHDG